MEQPEILVGIVDRLLFRNSDNGFTVFVLQLAAQTTTIVKGCIPQLHPGQRIEVHGTWITHPKFGKQFDAQLCNTQQPVTRTGLVKYLSSGLIKGIGPVYAEKLVAHFGTTVLEVIDLQPERLSTVPGIGQKRAATIIAGWQEQKIISHLMVFLQDKDISPTLATKIYKKYGHNARAMIQENPYRMTDDIWGIGFKTADQVAQKLGFTHNCMPRIKAGIIFILNSVTQKGNLYILIDDLKTTAVELLGLITDDDRGLIKQALHTLHDQQKIIVLTHNEDHFLALSSYYYTEKGVAQKVLNLQKTTSHCIFDIQALYHQLRTQSNQRIALNDNQQHGILTCLQNKVTIITGGPGTGKTTLIKQLLVLLDQNKVRYKLAAPTGRAAKRIQESTGKHASTLHRLLEFDASIMGFKRDEQNALDLDFLIIDEASMIDIFLAHAIFKALPFQAHVVLIGDIDQLPSVGAGNVLLDLIKSSIIPIIRLTTIFRQAHDSLIIINAHRINQGEFPLAYVPDTRKDFLFIKEDLPENVPHHLETIFTKILHQNAIKPDETAVLSPMHRGMAGTLVLNQYLQQLLNPTTSEAQLSSGGSVFKVGDRVMQIRNNYDKSVFNGDSGYIGAIDVTDRIINVNFGDQSIDYEANELDELNLAYAISIHKSQGSEYAAVIVPIFMQHFTLLQRNLIYTAITRAKKLCIFIGQPRAIAMAIKNNKEQKRITFLADFLTTSLTGR